MIICEAITGLFFLTEMGHKGKKPGKLGGGQEWEGKWKHSIYPLG